MVHHQEAAQSSSILINLAPSEIFNERYAIGRAAIDANNVRPVDIYFFCIVRRHSPSAPLTNHIGEFASRTTPQNSARALITIKHHITRVAFTNQTPCRYERASLRSKFGNRVENNDTLMQSLQTYTQKNPKMNSALGSIYIRIQS